MGITARIYNIMDGDKVLHLTAAEVFEMCDLVSLTAVYSRLEKSSDLAYLTKPAITGHKNYGTHILDDGSVVTTKDVAEVAKISINCAYNRLRKSKDPTVVYAINPKASPKGFVEASADRWVGKQVKVYGGIPMNPDYMDGPVYDRSGSEMTTEDATSLMHHRERQRKQWLKDSKNNIINKEK